MAKCIRFIHIMSSELCMECRIVSLHVFVRMNFKSGLYIYFFFYWDTFHLICLES